MTNGAKQIAAAEHILNYVTLTVKHAVMFDRRFARGFHGSRNAALASAFAEPIGSITFVTEESFAFSMAASINVRLDSRSSDLRGAARSAVAQGYRTRRAFQVQASFVRSIGREPIKKGLSPQVRFGFTP